MKKYIQPESSVGQEAFRKFED